MKTPFGALRLLLMLRASASTLTGLVALSQPSVALDALLEAGLVEWNRGRWRGRGAPYVELTSEGYRRVDDRPRSFRLLELRRRRETERQRKLDEAWARKRMADRQNQARGLAMGRLQRR